MASEHLIDGRIGRRTPAWLRGFATFNLICLGYIMFRSTDLGDFGDYISRFLDWGPATLWTLAGPALRDRARHRHPAAAAAAGGAIQAWIENRQPIVLAVGLAAVILFVGATVPSQGVPPFIYFQF